MQDRRGGGAPPDRRQSQSGSSSNTETRVNRPYWTVAVIEYTVPRAGQGFQILTDLGITLEKVRNETPKLIVCDGGQTERKEQ